MTPASRSWSREPTGVRRTSPAAGTSSPARWTRSAAGLHGRGPAGLDAGASTGGFTDVLLRRGAAQVVCVDVGYGQLAWSLQTDDAGHGARPDERPRPRPGRGRRRRSTWWSADLSFISLRLVLPALVACADAGRRPGADGEAAVRGRSGARSAPAASCASRSCGPTPSREVAAAAHGARAGRRRRHREPAAGAGGQRRVLPVAAARRAALARRAAAASSGPSRRARSDGGDAQRCCFVAHTGRRRGAARGPRAQRERFAAAGVGVRVLADEAAELGLDGRRGRRPAEAAAADGCELVVVFGGDGTLLRGRGAGPADAARRCSASTSATSASSPRPSGTSSTTTVDRVVARDYTVEERMTLDVTVTVDGEVVAATGRSTRPRSRRPAASGCSRWWSRSTAGRCRGGAATGSCCATPTGLDGLRVLRRRAGGLARGRGAAAGADQRARAVRPAAGRLAGLGAGGRGAAAGQTGRGAVVRRPAGGRAAAAAPGSRSAAASARCGWPGCTPRRSPTGWWRSSTCRCWAGAARGARRATGSERPAA